MKYKVLESKAVTSADHTFKMWDEFERKEVDISFNELIKIAIDDGWLPVGGVSITLIDRHSYEKYRYAQAMVREDD